MDEKIERWIPKFEGEYSCDRQGNIYSYKHNKRIKRKLTKDYYGYYVLVLIKNGKRFHVKAHRLVALTWLEGYDETINHKNGIKTDNRVENLEWLSFAENSIHAGKNGLMAKGSECHKSKLNDDLVMDIRNAKRFGFTAKEVSDAYGITTGSVYNVWRGSTWKHLPVIHGSL